MPAFATIYRQAWDQDVTFISENDPGADAPGDFVYVIVHAYFGDEAVLADIPNRGMCTPSGHIEPGESPLDAAIRETYEETGGRVDAERCKLIGYHCFIPRSGDAAGSARYAAAFVAEVDHFDGLPTGSESRGFITIPTNQVASRYFLWDELMAAVFAYADSERARLT